MPRLGSRPGTHAPAPRSALAGAACRLLLLVSAFACLAGASASASALNAAAAAADPPVADDAGGQININSASAAAMADALPGIGAVKAQAIVTYREQNGPFESVDALLAVSGIGPKTLERLRPLITVGAERTAAADARERETVEAVRRVIARTRRQALAPAPENRQPGALPVARTTP